MGGGGREGINVPGMSCVLEVLSAKEKRCQTQADIDISGQRSF